MSVFLPHLTTKDIAIFTCSYLTIEELRDLGLDKEIPISRYFREQERILEMKDILEVFQTKSIPIMEHFSNKFYNEINSIIDFTSLLTIYFSKNAVVVDYIFNKFNFEFIVKNIAEYYYKQFKLKNNNVVFVKANTRNKCMYHVMINAGTTPVSSEINRLNKMISLL